MSANTLPIELSKLSVKIVLNILDKYKEKHVFGSPVEQDAFNDAYRKIRIALIELTYMDGKE